MATHNVRNNAGDLCRTHKCLVQPRQASPDIHNIISDPRAAVEKGWSLLSYVGKAAVEFGRTVNDSYVKPAAGQLADPRFREQVRGNINQYVNSFTQLRVKREVGCYCLV